jgi:hypothetical protein
MAGRVRPRFKPADAGHKKRSLHFMNRLWVWAIVAFVPIAIVVSAAWSPGIAPGASGTPSGEVITHQPSRAVGMPLGMAGCSAAACHGAPAEAMLTGGPTTDAWRCAGTFWLAADPHTQAYPALESEFAASIMIRLTGEKEPGKPSVEATSDLRCLACHTNPSFAAPESPFASLRAEGIGCEACHGNSSGWLHAHTTWTASQRDRAYEQTGMAKLYDLGERAAACAGCHVGAPADFPVKGYPVRDMNHDMIAAGHPRLNFDFADYQRRLPPHWQEQDRSPDFEIQAWLIGRVVHTEAACRLLEDRAKRAQSNDPRTPWPEFSEYNCVSCHHALGKSYPAPGGPRKPGEPEWQVVWPVTEPASFEILLTRLNAGEIGVPALQRLHQAVEKPLPKLEPSRTAANEASAVLLRVRERFRSIPAARFNDAFTALFADIRQNRIESLDRDRAGQLYHALAARQRWTAQQKQMVQSPKTFESLRKNLRLSRGNLSFDIPAEARADLKELLDETHPVTP